MICHLGLGSNLAPRESHLEKAIKALEKLSSKNLRVSPIYETQAWLPQGADASWDRPYLNIAVEIASDLGPDLLLRAVKEIERDLGRDLHAPRWAPRPIDIDVLLMGETIYESPNLKIPHADLQKRPFVLAPLRDLAPNLILPGIQKTVLEARRASGKPIPLLMAICNLTPDSFSDGGNLHPDNFASYLEDLGTARVGIIDVGAESTRPNATPVEEVEEWERLQPALAILKQKFSGKMLRPLISVDTRHFSVAQKALKTGIVDILNDVSGLSDPRFLELLQQYPSCQYVLMHSLAVPANPSIHLSNQMDPVQEIRNWFINKLNCICQSGVHRSRVILDPGLGFGKTRTQSWKLVQNVEAFYDLECRVLMGHSRKSFLRNETTTGDWQTVGLSLALADKGVDILRVHNVDAHKHAFLGFNKAQPNTF